MRSDPATGPATFEYTDRDDTAVHLGEDAEGNIVSGTYVLRIRAHDGSRATNKDITVVIGNYTLPGNLAPQMNPGIYTGNIGQVIQLNGTYYDDGLPSLPGTTITEWLVASGPGNELLVT